MTAPENLDRFDTLVNIIAKLRASDGCPWDRQQTHDSLRKSLLEECYEVLAALDEGDSRRLCDELGDLLMQVVLHSQIASEAGEFQLAEVVGSINAKLVHRHPHIFGEKKVKDAEEVALNWEALKKEEREDGHTLLESVPPSMPALEYAEDVQSRAARVGFDWKEIQGVMDKLVEEVDELRRAATPEEKEAEFGDLLFTLVNLARRTGIDAESALRRANRRFYRRFTYMEKLCRQRGLDLAKMSLDEQNALWEEAKGATG